jgi:hypothetical protein
MTDSGQVGLSAGLTRAGTCPIHIRTYLVVRLTVRRKGRRIISAAFGEAGEDACVFDDGL